MKRNDLLCALYAVMILCEKTNDHLTNRLNHLTIRCLSTSATELVGELNERPSELKG